MISQLKNFDILLNKFFNILICLCIVFTLNLSVILFRKMQHVARTQLHVAYSKQ